MILRMSSKLRRISVTEAARNFADLVNRAFYRGETTVLVKNGVPVAHISPGAPTGLPASEILRRWNAGPRLTESEVHAWERDIAGARAALPPVRDPWA